jgi:dTDP-4-dehydrorhamnose reductase
MTGRRVAITGASGQLGRQLVAAFRSAGWEAIGLSRADLDITEPRATAVIQAGRHDVVVNAAAWTDVDGCAREPERAMAVNGSGAGLVARAAAQVGGLLVQVSTNEVFDGSRKDRYSEGDEPEPINAYGSSKLAGEREVAGANPRHLIVRTAWIFGPGGRNFPSKIMKIARSQAAAGQALRVVSDELGNPTWAPDLAEGIRMATEAVIAERIAPGIIHIAGEPPTSRYYWAEAILDGIPGVELVPIPAADYPRTSRVPPHAVLATERASAAGIRASDWRMATARYASELFALSV